jgi:hypothetical protein
VTTVGGRTVLGKETPLGLEFRRKWNLRKERR